ncbi:hypothetical protein ACHAW5_000100 [Stephanodiscus triporus]|uniref:Peptidase M4 domain-containing protein n=1 Tax=Stephanodiscus triporus TaxID=2934178 RepID=A0ABD3P4T7_9STRA
MMVHSDPDGNVLAVNGKLVNDSTVPSAEPTINFATAIAIALAKSRILSEFHSQCGKPSLTIVHGLNDGESHLAWTYIVRYNVIDEEGYYSRPYRDQIFAYANGDMGLIQFHSLIYGALFMNTKNCIRTTTACSTISTSNNTISMSDTVINDAHNYDIDTYNYYKTKFGWDSINGAGMTLASQVHYDVDHNNAFWYESQMTYGDGDGVTFSLLSQGLNIVAHELTHGITEWESSLMFMDESGALTQ